MNISGRNKISGTVQDIKAGGVMTQVTLDIGGHQLTSIVSNDSISELGLKAGDQVTALIKATSVMLMK